jgi:hypothetical protein
MNARPSSDLTFRKLLDNVQGSSEFVIAVIIDVRDFSSFAMKVESVQTTAFLKRIYIEMIDSTLGTLRSSNLLAMGCFWHFPMMRLTLKKSRLM